METNLVFNGNTTSGVLSSTDGVGSLTTIANNSEILQGAQNNTLGYVNYYPYYYSYPYTPAPLLSVDKAENGFIIKKSGKTYIAKTAEEIVKYLK